MLVDVITECSPNTMCFSNQTIISIIVLMFIVCNYAIIKLIVYTIILTYRKCEYYITSTVHETCIIEITQTRDHGYNVNIPCRSHAQRV